MRRNLTKFISSVFGKKERAPAVKMAVSAATRFFPNNLSDYDRLSTPPVSVPEDHFVKEIGLMIDNITTHIKPVELNAEDGLYLGTAGIAYMYYHLSKIPAFGERRNDLLNEAVEYIKPSLAVAQKYAMRRNDVPSFLLGNCGIYAVAAAIYNSVGDAERSQFFRKLYYDAADTCKELRFLDCGSDELFVGRAGYLTGAMWLAKETGTNMQLDDLYEISRVMVASGREYAARHQSDAPLMYSYYEVEYFGAAHGLCSILQALLSVPNYLDVNPADAKDIKATVDYLLNLQDSEGNFPSASDDIHDHHDLLHWCHGGPGIIYLMAKAYLVWNEVKYLRSCERIADNVWNKGLLKKGPGLCHGVAGNGYVFLLLYRLTGNPMYLHRAVTFGRFMESEDFKRFSRVPDNPFSLYEGISGTVCFLADVTTPTQAYFPFSDVF